MHCCFFFLPPTLYLSNFYMKLSLKLVSTFTACLSCVLITIFCVCFNVHCATYDMTLKLTVKFVSSLCLLF